MTGKIEELEQKLASATTAEKFDIYTNLIREYRHQNKPDLSISALEEAKKLFPEITDRVLKSNFYYQQGIIHLYDSKYSLSQKNLLIAYHLLSRQKAENMDFLKMRILLGLGTTKQKQGLHHRALAILQKAEIYAQRAKNKNHIARLQNWLAISYANLGQNDQALKLNFAALDIFRSENNLEWMSNIYNSIGLIYYHLQDDNESLAYFQQALDIHAQVETKMGEANVLNNLGMLFRRQKDFTKALQYYQRSIEIRQKFVGKIMLANTYQNIADIYLQLQDYKQSIATAEKGLELSIAGDDYERTFDFYIILTSNHLHQDQMEMAREYMQKAEKICASLEQKHCKISKYQLQAIFCEKRKDFTQALELQKKINKLQQEINLEKISSQNRLLHKMHEYEKRQQLSSIYKEKNKALAKANDQLSSSLHKLDVTNHILRHDLLNNLAVITSALKNHERTQDPNYLQHIQLRTKDSIELIKSLSTLSKTPQKIAANGSLKIDLYKLITSVMASYPEVEFDIIGSGTLLSDKRMKSVFANLIDNAIRHGKTPKIDFEISQTISQTKIKISDYGKGIEPAIADKIFEKDFHYGETGHTGLGLYIAREVVAENKGELCYQANQPQGSIFEVTLRNS